MVIRAVIGVLLAATAGIAQTSDGLPHFDTISIRPAGPQITGQPISGSSGGADQGHITYYRRSLASLVMEFYGVAVDQIVVPEEMYETMYGTSKPETFQFTISVTMPRDTPQQQVQLMMQNLLADRFHFKMHHETRNFPGYELVVAEKRRKAVRSGYGAEGRQWQHWERGDPAAGERGDYVSVCPPVGADDQRVTG